MESDLELTNVNGNITLACTGFLITDSVNGDIGIYKVRKGVKASAVNGAIQTQFEQDPDRECNFSSVNGPISVAFREAPNLDVNIDTVNGSIDLHNLSFTGTREKKKVQGRINQADACQYQYRQWQR